MKRISFILLLTWLVTVNVAMANPVTESRARTIAARFIATQSPTLKLSSSSPVTVVTATTQQAAYYVFNTTAAADRGFVIVAGDDRLPAVLGYSDSGSFDANDVPPAMQQWLDGYTAQIAAITAGGVPEVRTASRPAIAPMLPVHWGQGLPYNVLLPHISGSSNAHAYVGCVAVAMAQIMAFWKHPQRPTATIPGYTSSSGKTYQVTMPSLVPIDFDWENMHYTYYTNDSTSEACQAVANLMLYSTTSLKSNFGLTSTGSYTRNIPEMLITYFGYKNSAHYIYRETYSTQAWEDVIYAELAAGRPVAYGGNKQSAGHAFVCDGYDGDGRFHINWGWAGKSNGYFLLNLLNPSDEGIGSAAGAYGYVKGQGAAIGLEPAGDGNEGEAALTFDDLTISSSNSTRSAASSNFTVSVSGKFVNYTHVSSMFSQGWGLFKDGEMVENLFYRSTTSSLGNQEYITVSARSLSFGAGITSGTYRILPIYTIYGANDWHPCIGADVNYIEVTFGGNYSCTIKGYGTAGSTTRYTVNSCTTQGTLNHGKPVTVNLNLTNSGTSTNDLIYMFVNGEFTAMGLANIAAHESGDIVYRFTPTTAGIKTLTFSLNESGASPFHTQLVTIGSMPSATLDVSYRILGITDEDNRIITADRYSIIADVTNTGTEPYDEDFSVRLYRINNDETNVGTELLSQTQPLHLAAGASTSLQFDFDHDLVDGWKYFCYLYYYSAGETVGKGTKWYYLNLTGTPITPVNRYAVTTIATPSQGGKVSVTGPFSGGKVKAGETVTITTRPNTGWECTHVTATDTMGNPVEFNTAVNGTYTLIMPESDLTVTGHFARSTGSLFELVDARSSITADDTYILVSRSHDKVMKHWNDGDETFQSDDIVAWLDDEQAVARVNDDACFFTMTQVTDTTVSGNARTAAYLCTGNAFLRTSNYHVLQSHSIAPESRAWMYIGNASNCLIRFKDSSSGSNGNWIVRYDSDSEAFKVMNWTVTGAETSRVWLYKLVDAHRVDIDCDAAIGCVNVTGGLVGESAQRGETVTFTVTPAQGSASMAVVVTTASGEVVNAMLDDATGIYTFIMPDDDVTIAVTPCETFITGDVDRDGRIDISDVTALIDFLLTGNGDIDLRASDVDEDGRIDISDVTALIDWILNK